VLAEGRRGGSVTLLEVLLLLALTNLLTAWFVKVYAVKKTVHAMAPLLAQPRAKPPVDGYMEAETSEPRKGQYL
jgi:hypothetical protein